MSRHHELNASSPSRAANVRFLAAFDNKIFSDDNGALLGQLSMLRAGMFVEARYNLEWHQAVSVAVSAH